MRHAPTVVGGGGGGSIGNEGRHLVTDRRHRSKGRFECLPMKGLFQKMGKVSKMTGTRPDPIE